jgi:hypothetical protein
VFFIAQGHTSHVLHVCFTCTAHVLQEEARAAGQGEPTMMDPRVDFGIRDLDTVKVCVVKALSGMHGYARQSARTFVFGSAQLETRYGRNETSIKLLGPVSVTVMRNV